MVKELGKTTLGKPFLLAIISSAENIKNIDRYQAIQQQLANPYDLSEKKARSLMEEGKVVVLVSLNIHSTEIASSQESVELAYEMATRIDPGIKKILDNVILLLIPSLNPDGQQMVVDWYKKHVGTPYEDCNEKAVTYSILDLAATYKKKFMMNFYSMNKESIERGKKEPPYAFIVPLGVDVVEMKIPLQVGLSLTDTFDFGPSGMIDAPAKVYLLERRYNNSFAVLNELLKDNTDVYWSGMEFSIDGKTYPAGTFIIPAQKGIDKKLQSLVNEFKVSVYGIDQPVPVKGTKALLPRLGLYHSWTASMDEGWTRLVLDNYRYSYKKLYNEEIKKGKLAEKFDVIILPDVSTESIFEGKRRRWEYSEPSLADAQQPEKYRGGIGKEGVKALTEFVKAGGILITFGQASDFAIEKMWVPAINVLKGIDPKEFYAPGSLLQIDLDTTQPLELSYYCSMPYTPAA